MIYSQTAYCHAWGSAKNARRVHGLSKEERDMIRNGAGQVRIADCPSVRGVTDRRIIVVSCRFYARMP